ncbi:hypothetical protein DZG03_03025, partial [Clavibacter phaseoli]
HDVARGRRPAAAGCGDGGGYHLLCPPTPGAFCKKTEVGSVEKSDTGKSYRCGPDADGQRNRWYPM